MFAAVIVFFSRDIYVNCVMIFLVGICTNSMVGLSYLYGQEIVPKKYIFFAGAIYNCSTGFSIVLSSIYFKWLSKNWFYIEVFFFGLKVISNVLIYLLPESPKYLIEMKEYDQAKEVFNYIANINGKPGLDLSKDELLQR